MSSVWRYKFTEHEESFHACVPPLLQHKEEVEQPFHSKSLINGEPVWTEHSRKAEVKPCILVASFFRSIHMLQLELVTTILKYDANASAHLKRMK